MEYISILGDTSFLACRNCYYSILPSSIHSHFQGKPHQLSPEIREEILQETRKHASLIWDRDNLKETRIPSSFPFFFPELAFYNDGLACQDYSYIVRSKAPIKKHYREVHSWENPRGKGRIPKTSNIEEPWATGISCQQFFLSNPGHSYFRVDSKRPFSDRQTRPRTASSVEEERNEDESEIRSERSEALSEFSQGITRIFFYKIVVLTVYIEPRN